MKNRIISKKELSLHSFKPWYSLGCIIKRPRGYMKCKGCGMIVHEDGHVVKEGKQFEQNRKTC